MGARTVIGVFASLAVAAAHAQETPLPEGASPEGPSLEDLNAAAPPAELSELERLSRTEDDPFAGVLEREEREPVSVTLRALDKITARYTDIEIEMNAIARFGSLEIQPRTCDKRPPEEFPETTAFLEIFDTESDRAVSNLKAAAAADVDDAEPVAAPAEEPVLREIEPSRPDLLETPLAALAQTPAPEVLEGPQAEGENIFRGWMFASSPALNALEHPVYDVWVIDCKTRVASN